MKRRSLHNQVAFASVAPGVGLLREAGNERFGCCPAKPRPGCDGAVWSIVFFQNSRLKIAQHNVVIMGHVASCFSCIIHEFPHYKNGNMPIRVWASAKKPDYWWIHENLNSSYLTSVAVSHRILNTSTSNKYLYSCVSVRWKAYFTL